MIRTLRIFAAAFAAAFAREILPKPAEPEAELIELPCGDCNPDCDECACLESIGTQANIEGYSIEDLHRDIECLERSHE